MSPDSDVLNRSAYLLRLFQSVMSGYSVDHPLRDVPADDPGDAVRAGILGDLLLVDVVLLEVRVAPVLEDDVDLTGVEALPGDLLGEVGRLDRVAELFWSRYCDDGDVRLGADPLVDGDLDGALAGHRRRRAAAAAPTQRRDAPGPRTRETRRARRVVPVRLDPAIVLLWTGRRPRRRSLERAATMRPSPVRVSSDGRVGRDAFATSAARRRPPAPWVIRSSMIPEQDDRDARRPGPCRSPRAGRSRR